jgi:PAS domain S-box-containing protein
VTLDPTPVSSDEISRRVARRVAALATGIALLVLGSWVLDAWSVLTLGPNYVPMAPLTALFILALAATVWGRSRPTADDRFSIPSLLLGLGTAGAALAVAHAQYTGVPLPIEAWFARTDMQVGGIAVGRVSRYTALLIATLGLAAACPRRPLATARIAVGLALVVIVACVLVLEGYLLGGPPLYESGTIPVAAASALCLLLLAVGVLLATGADRWPTRLFFPQEASADASPSPWSFRTLTVFLGLVIISSGYFWLRGNQAQTERAAGERLEALAQLKADQVSAWFEGHLSTARAIQALPIVANTVTDLRGGAGDRVRLTNWLRTLRIANEYVSASLYDGTGALVVSDGPVIVDHDTLARRVIEDGRTVIVDDLHSHGNTMRLNLWIPLSNSSARPFAWVLLEIDPRTTLFPTLQDVPLRTPTLEMVLWGRDGDTAVVLNDAADFLGDATRARVLISDTSTVPGVRGILGDTSMRRGTDHRGRQVFASARAVEGRTWVIVATIDRAEVTAPLTSAAITTTVISLLLMLGAVVAVDALWSRRDLATASRELRLIRDREESIEELRVSEARYARVMRGTSDGLWDWEIDTGALYVSPRWREILGLEGQSVRSEVNEFFARVHPDDRDQVNAALDRHLQHGIPYDVEFRIRHADGSYRWVRDRGEVERPAAGQPRRMSGAITDISGRRAIQESLDRTDRILRVRSAGNLALVRTTTEQELLQAICDVAVREGGYRMAWIGFAEHDVAKSVRPVASSGDLDGYLDFVRVSWDAESPVGKGPTGRAIREGVPQPAQDLLNESNYSPWREAAAVRGYASSCSIPLRARHEVVGVLALYSGEAHAFDATEVALLTEVAADLSFGIAAKRDHAALVAQQAQLALFRQVMERSNDAVYLFDAESGRFIDFNQTAAQVLGYSFTELRELGPEDVVVGMGGDRSWAHTVAEIRSRGDILRRSVHRRRDGTEFPVEVALTAIEVEGRLLILSIARDITDRDRAENEREALRLQLLQAQKMESVGRLAGGVAHDFNNLLTVINATADLALHTAPTGAPIHSDLMEIRAAGERAAGLTRQLLAFSRQQVMHRRVVDLNQVVTDFLRMLRRVIGEDIQLDVALADGAALISADPGQLEQVLMNLAVNARDAMPNGGSLSIHTAPIDLDAEFVARHASTKVGPHILLRVRDSGHGMDEATQSKIFEPFFTTKETGKGTGLGLAMVYGIIKQSGASIWLDSAPGVGSTFDIYFPTVTEDVSERASLPITVQTNGTESVLLVEDEESIRLVARRVLERAGYVVYEAEHGAAALALLSAHEGPLHLLLTDLVMPGMSGVDLADEVAARYPSIKVLLTSGYSADAVAADDPRFTRWTLLSKPYSVRDLLQQVRRTLDTP